MGVGQGLSHNAPSRHHPSINQTLPRPWLASQPGPSLATYDPLPPALSVLFDRSIITGLWRAVKGSHNARARQVTDHLPAVNQPRPDQKLHHVQDGPGERCQSSMKAALRRAAAGMVTSVVIDASALTELRRLDAPRSEHRDVVVRLGKLLLVVQGHRTVHGDRLLATRAANISHARHICGQLAAWGCLLVSLFCPRF